MIVSPILDEAYANGAGLVRMVDVDARNVLRVLIIADDPLARAGLAMLISSTPGFVTVGQAASTDDLDNALNVYRPDITLWDLGWASEESLNHLSDFAQPNTSDSPSLPALVVLAPDTERASQAWSAGVRSILLRRATAGTLAAALRAAAQGLWVIEPDLAPVLMARRESTEPITEPLTAREREVLQLLAQGASNKTIARALQISEHTVKFHVNSIMTKLGVESRTEAVVRATRAGLVLL